MDQVYSEKAKKVIRQKLIIPFKSHSSHHLISITARVRGEKQISPNTTDDEDLLIKIDGKTFPKLSNSNALIDSPAAFSGGETHNLAKTVFFLTFLKGQNHTIGLETDKPSQTAILENASVSTFSSEETLLLDINNQAEDGNQRAWIVFAFDNLPFKSFTPKVSYARRKKDSDDIKIIIDGKAQTNPLKIIKHATWKYAGRLLPKFFPAIKTESETFSVNLPAKLHYLEFEADRMPILKDITIDFGPKLNPPIRIPSATNPKWTGDFYDDPPEVILARLIFGEAENTSRGAKIGIGFTVINRVKKQNANWGTNLHEVILKPNQYDAIWNNKTSDKVRDPLNNASSERTDYWQESYQAAKGILEDSLEDPAFGSTNFHSYIDKADFPPWATDKNFKVKIGPIYFYELEK